MKVKYGEPIYFGKVMTIEEEWDIKRVDGTLTAYPIIYPWYVKFWKKVKRWWNEGNR